MIATPSAVRPEHLAALPIEGLRRGTVTVTEHPGSDIFSHMMVDGIGQMNARVGGEFPTKHGGAVFLATEGDDKIHRFGADGLTLRRLSSARRRRSRGRPEASGAPQRRAMRPRGRETPSRTSSPSRPERPQRRSQGAQRWQSHVAPAPQPELAATARARQAAKAGGEGDEASLRLHSAGRTRRPPPRACKRADRPRRRTPPASGSALARRTKPSATTFRRRGAACDRTDMAAGLAPRRRDTYRRPDL
jgi:hypothetical protein